MGAPHPQLLCRGAQHRVPLTQGTAPPRKQGGSLGKALKLEGSPGGPLPSGGTGVTQDKLRSALPRLSGFVFVESPHQTNQGQTSPQTLTFTQTVNGRQRGRGGTWDAGPFRG